MTHRLSGSTFLAIATLLTVGCRADRALSPDPLLASFAAGTPAPLTATAASAAIEVYLTWADRSPNETGFEVHRATGTSGSFALLHTTAAGVTAHTDVPAAGNTTYC